MLNLKKVKETSISYKLLKKYVDWWHNVIFYHRVTIMGKENIPDNKAVLFAPNHQNALMDALAILCVRKHDPVFLTRSDIFSPDFMGNLFVFMKMLPIYRIRDGKDKLERNNEIFNLCVEVLENNKRLTIFPEAQHTTYRSLLKLKKGLMRIAFSTAEKSNFDIDLSIIPTGIYYSNFTNYRSKLLVNFGKPIKIADYKELYAENQQAAMFKLRNDLREKMIPQTIHIENKNDYYSQFEDARDLYDFYVAEKLNLKLKKPDKKFIADKKIIEILNKAHDDNIEEFNFFTQKQDNYTAKIKKHNFKDFLFDSAWSKTKLFLTSLIGVILSPIYFVGLLIFLIPLVLPEIFVKKFKDDHFHSSVRFVISLIFIPIWSLIGFILLWIFVKTWWVKFLFVIILPALLIFWQNYMRLFRKTIGHWRFIFKKKARKNIVKQRNELITLFSDYCKRFNPHYS